MKLYLIGILLLITSACSGQFTDRYWCFGDSAGIDFRNLGNPVPGECVLRSRGTSSSICDSAGNLLFYCGNPNVDLWLNTTVSYLGMILNKNNQIMEGGDSIVGSTWYRQMIIIPDPGNLLRFYVFAAGITPTTNPGLYYCIVDLSYNNGLGKVIQKNVQLQTFPVCDGLAAVKHGNGRDWWLLFKEYNPSVSSYDYLEYLITPQGISNLILQTIGLPTGTNLLRLDYSKSGNKLSMVDNFNNMELFDFDRCSGLLSNPNPLHTQSLDGMFWSSTFSPDESKLYMTEVYSGNGDSVSYLFQFNLNDTGNIFNTIDTLETMYKPYIAAWVQRAPDGKVYFNTFLEIYDCEFFYLYCDTSYYRENTYLGVINSPNSLGTLADYQPYSFYLGGHRTYWGFPNNPNYELIADSTSLCDTLLTVASKPLNETPSPKLSVYYASSWYTAFINASGLEAKEFQLCITDAVGKIIFQEKAKTQDGYFTRDLPLLNLAPGIYYAVLFSDGGKISAKFVVM